VTAAALAAPAGLEFACASTGHPSLNIAEIDAGDDGAAPAAITGPAPLNTRLITDKSLCTPGKTTVDWSPLRRISRVEYDNMVRDLLSDTTQPATGFVPESPIAHGVNFEANTYTSVSTLIAQQYQQAAETLAKTAVSDANNLNNNILPCHTQDDACAKQFIARFANRAFRGQLDDTESAGLFQLYSDVKAQFDFTTGVQAVITAVLESPRFLYVLEFGQGTPTGNVVPLSSYELAGRLAFLLWRSVPDPTLMQAAGAGQLSTPDQIQTQAARMLMDAKAADALDDFTTQWLQLQGTPTLGKDVQFTNWNDQKKPRLATAMLDETLTNVSQLVLAENGSLTELLTSPSSHVNDELASFYGVAKGSGSPVTVNDTSLAQGQATFVKTDLSSNGRAGILTNGSVLATQAHTTLPSSVLRGKLVREDILCDPIPPPPPKIPPPPTSVVEGGTTRSTFEAHETMPGCASCHQFMDPIGFGFGHFDATGAWQNQDLNGLMATGPAIDATGQINAMTTGEFSATFNGAVDLVTQLAKAPQTQECFVIQELRYALSRIETTADACSAQQAFGAFSAAQWNIQKVLIAIVRSDTFRYRSVQTAGSACQ
jgi:hypothetical protein